MVTKYYEALGGRLVERLNTRLYGLISSQYQRGRVPAMLGNGCFMSNVRVGGGRCAAADWLVVVLVAAEAAQ